jgi:selenocysteine lyase/cysteine desulfurase
MTIDATTSIEDFVADFDEEPGYLDFATVGPPSRSVIEEERGLLDTLGRARFGSLNGVRNQGARVRAAVTALTRVPGDRIVFQPNTSTGLMHALFGLTGPVLLSPAEFPSVPFAAVRAQQALGVVTPQWLPAKDGRVTPAGIRDALTADTAAVAVSLVDSRTGYLADLEGIRQVIGTRLLIVDAIQGFGVVDAPWEVADVIATGGQKWVRAGWGTGFLALSERAAETLVPVMSGFVGTPNDDLPWDAVPDPARGARAFRTTNADPLAEARLAVALERIAEAGVPAISERIAHTVSRVVDLADEAAIAVVSSRAENERAGIVVIEPPENQLTALGAALFNHGITATVRQGRVRLSVHASTSEETLDMIRAAFTSFGTTITY